MDMSQKTVANWVDWCRYIRKVLPDQKFNIKFAGYQWQLYWSGERGSVMWDLAIYLMDKYGYEQEL